MGLITERLVNQIERQVLASHLVLWFDPGGRYAEVARTLSLPETRVERYEGSYFALRRAVDDLLNDDLPPRLVVYVPLDQAETREALAELTAAGVVMRPGEPARERNTRL